MKRLLSPKGLKVWQKYGLSLLVLLATVATWPGCSDDPVTPRESVIGTWELITLKVNGVETEYLYDIIMVFYADSTGYMELYLEEDLIDSEEFDSWETKGDSITTIIGSDVNTAWYSCTDDRLTIRGYDESEDETREFIYARVEDL